MSVLFGMLLGDFTGGGAAVMAAQVVLHSSNSRDKEAAADRFGAELVSRVGGEPRTRSARYCSVSPEGDASATFLARPP